jgi:hypothetical protein
MHVSSKICSFPISVAAFLYSAGTICAPKESCQEIGLSFIFTSKLNFIRKIIVGEKYRNAGYFFNFQEKPRSRFDSALPWIIKCGGSPWRPVTQHETVLRPSTTVVDILLF